MRVLFLTGREIEYSRNAVLLNAFKRFATVDVIAASTTKPSHYMRNFKVVWQGLVALKRQTYDLVFIGFYGHIILRLMSPFIRQPILFDAFISNYDTICFDRQLFAPNSAIGHLAFWLDRTNCMRSTKLLIDTEQHAKYFIDTFDIAATKISVLPVGCRDDIFNPRLSAKQQDEANQPTINKSRTSILYYCTYLPLHGVEIVLNTAKMLEAEAIDFYLVGEGPLFQSMIRKATALRLKNLTFRPPVSVKELADLIAKADICLGGHFGESAKAGRVVPGKIYQMLAMAKPIIATNTPANSHFLCHGESAFLIPPNNASALTKAIVCLHHNPEMCKKLAIGGRQLYITKASEQTITEQLRIIVVDLVKTSDFGETPQITHG